MKALLAFIIKYKTGAKVGGGFGIGAAVLSAVVYLHGDITLEIAHAEARAKEYTGDRVTAIQESNQLEIDHLKTGQTTILEAIEKLETRIYDHSVKHSNN